MIFEVLFYLNDSFDKFSVPDSLKLGQRNPCNYPFFHAHEILVCTKKVNTKRALYVDYFSHTKIFNLM